MVDNELKPRKRYNRSGPKGKNKQKENAQNKAKERSSQKDPNTVAEKSAPVVTAQGISTDSFNDLLTNFTKALTVSTSQSDGSNVNQNQMLCEMGKLFLTSMMTFNQILQSHAGAVSSNLATSEAVVESPKRAVGSKSARNQDNSNKVQDSDQRKEDCVTAPNTSIDNSEQEKEAIEAASPVRGQNPVNNNPRQGKFQQGNQRNGKSGAKGQWQRQEVAGHSDQKATKRQQQRQPRYQKGKKQGVDPKFPKKNETPAVPALAQGTVTTDVAKEDFNNAPTPNNTDQPNGMNYLDGIMSPEKQLNFSIYQFVDSCTNAPGAAGKGSQGLEKLEWLNTKPVVPATETEPGPQDATCRVTTVIVSPAELLKAAFMGDVELLKLQDSVEVNHVDEVGRSALHYASAAGSVKCVEHLLKRGINVNLADRKGWTAIHIAVSKNFTEVAKLLIDAKADIFALLKHKCAPARLSDVYSSTIHFAAIKGNIEITKMLLEQGATVNIPDSANMTPLHYAAFRNNPDYVKYLLDNGAKCDIKDVNGRTPFHAAALSGMVTNVKLMVQHHAFINDEDVWSLTPYKLAELRNHKPFVTYLKEKLGITEEEDDDINRVIASTIAVALQEPNANQIYRCVTRIGAELCKTVFDLTMQIERNGGVLTADGSRRRTSGGIFFTCLRELYLNNIISKDDYNYIRAAENEKRIAKANERRSKLRSKS